MDEHVKSLGNTLRQAREKSGLSIRGLAARVGVGHAYIGHLETGERKNPPAELLEQIAEELGIEASDLLVHIGVKPASTLPPLRDYFMRKLGASGDEADILKNLVEYQLRTQRGEDGDTNQGRPGGAY